MCDTVVAVTQTGVWFGKNSDREPGEAQVVEHLREERHGAGEKVRATFIELDQVAHTHEVVLSRPFWMWGCEMGANAKGLVAGNEAVFTRVPYAKQGGLSGMDLQRLALERCASAREAVDLVTRLLAEHGQGGNCAYRGKMLYHNAFIFADAAEAWVLETAGPYWAAEKVTGVRTISNALSIGERYELIHPEAITFARRKGFVKPHETFHFARAFGSGLFDYLTAGHLRRACTQKSLSAGEVDFQRVTTALRDHGGLTPSQGLRLQAVCGHASYHPTRTSGQTTASMVSHLSPKVARHWLTGTSSPCLSVFKPVPLGGERVDTGPTPGAGFDADSLFWRHERLHRLVLSAYDARRAVFEAERAELEAKATVDTWAEHRELLLDWTERAQHVKAKPPAGAPLFAWYWKKQSALDRVPPRLER